MTDIVEPKIYKEIDTNTDKEAADIYIKFNQIKD